MIRLTRLNGREIVVNSDNVDFIESTPDTTVCFTNGRRLVVRDTVDEVMGKTLAYRRRLHEDRPWDNADPAATGPPEAKRLSPDEN